MHTNSLILSVFLGLFRILAWLLACALSFCFSSLLFWSFLLLQGFEHLGMRRWMWLGSFHQVNALHLHFRQLVLVRGLVSGLVVTLMIDV